MASSPVTKITKKNNSSHRTQTKNQTQSKYQGNKP